MRQIKFRGKAIKDNNFYIGDYYEENEKHFIRTKTPNPNKVYISYQIIPETIGQFTGMKDDDNNDIYEGDIIIWGAQLGSTSEVKYIEENLTYLVKDKFNDYQYLYDVVKSSKCKVIGNIHNKILLKNIKNK